MTSRARREPPIAELVLHLLRLYIPGFDLRSEPPAGHAAQRRSGGARSVGPAQPPKSAQRAAGRWRTASYEGARRTRSSRPDERGPAEAGGGAITAVEPTLAGCYAELEVPYGADLPAVRSAWRRLVREHHPDRHAADLERQSACAERMKRVNHAYGVLRARLRRCGR